MRGSVVRKASQIVKFERLPFVITKMPFLLKRCKKNELCRTFGRGKYAHKILMEEAEHISWKNLEPRRMVILKWITKM
jgi:hypothetical protein